MAMAETNGHGINEPNKSLIRWSSLNSGIQTFFDFIGIKFESDQSERSFEPFFYEVCPLAQNQTSFHFLFFRTVHFYIHWSFTLDLTNHSLLPVYFEVIFGNLPGVCRRVMVLYSDRLYYKRNWTHIWTLSSTLNWL